MHIFMYPIRAFDYLVGDYDCSINFQVYLLILKDNYDKLPIYDKEKLLLFIENQEVLKIEDVNIKDLNNPARF